MEAFGSSVVNLSSKLTNSSGHYHYKQLLMKIKEDGYLDYTGFELDNPPRYEPFEFERLDDWKSWVIWVHKHWDIPMYAGIIYITLIFGIQKFMKNRQAFELKRELFLWNTMLGIFSILGFIRMAPEFFGVLNNSNGFYTSVCIWQGGNMPTAFWGLMFCFSKFIELGDTIFITLRKRPLQLLQWYHHIVTLSVCWLTLPYVEPISRYYCIMNYFVHSLMYPYFAFAALGIKVPRSLANILTTLQLGQMLLGLGVNTYSGLKFYLGGSESCFRHPNSIKFFFIVYGSFAILFGNLFWKLVIKPRNNYKNQTLEMDQTIKKNE